jgi:Caspase domain
VKAAAVVIGVDRTGGLTTLKAAASGAQDVAAWLAQSGYEVTSFTDAPDKNGNRKAVTRKEIFDAVSEYVGRDNLDKLVIYFAGHGYLRSPSEIWLLSGAPGDPSEAVDQTTSVDMARASNIPNVVFISDCCRSVASELIGQKVTGATIFPNRAAGRIAPEIDNFFATRPGTAAIESEVKEWAKASGLFTRVLTASHRDPPSDKLLVVGNRQAVPSRWLRSVLPDRVDEEAQRTSLALTQRADIRLETENAYLAFAQFTPPPPPPQPPIAVNDFFRFGGGGGDFKDLSSLFRGLRGTGDRAEPARRWRDRTPKRAAPPAAVRGFEDFIREDASEAELGALARRVDDVRKQTPAGELVPDPSIPVWIAVEGTSVCRTASLEGGRPVRLLEHSGARAVGIPLDRDRHACSVAVEFADGSSIVVAGFRDYLCRIKAGGAGVEEVGYAPFAGPNRERYQELHEKIDEMRALANAAAARGLLHVDRKDGSRLARATRRYKLFDPALGMVASLAYAAAGMREAAGSVRRYAQADLRVDQFDIWLLAGAAAPDLPVYPFCPMMTQSWSYLDARGVKLHPLLRSAGRHSSFWTTFSAGEMEKIVGLMQAGELK